MADVTLRVTIGAVSVEVTGSEEYAERKLEELLGKYLGMSKPGVSAEARPAPIPLETGGKRLSVGEFMRRITSKNLTDRALGINAESQILSRHAVEDIQQGWILGDRIPLRQHDRAGDNR